MARRKRWAILALAAVAIAAVAVWQLWYPGRAFDPAAWQDKALIPQGIRLGMADRLLARGTLLGKTRAEVVAMLGKPPDTEYFREWNLVYWLGPERGGFFSIDSEWLVVRIGGDGRVAECRLVRD
jgi:hypothetical protein